MRRRSARRTTLVRMAAAGAAVTLLTAGCLEEGGGGGGGGGGEGGDGRVELMYGFGGDQSKTFEAEFEDWQAESGITVEFTEASQSFDKLIRTRVAGNDLPDIAAFPQPGLMLEMASQGRLTPLDEVLDVARLEEEMVPGYLDAATVEDKVYAAPFSMNIKSLVWYVPEQFDQAGYAIPETMDELLALTDQMRSDGNTPWCIGIESGPATGWPATDWMEDLVLRYAGPDVYDQWWKHEIPFNDPAIKEAAEVFERIAFTEGNVLGGRKGMASQAFQTAGNPMFDNPPGCFMHKQGNFITGEGFFPDNVRQNLGTAVDAFQLPGVEAGEAPMLGGGDLVATFNGDDPDVKKVIEFMTSPEFGAKSYIPGGGTMSPNTQFDVSAYPDDYSRKLAELAYGSSVFRFDGSDLMPGAVGAGTFWRGMVAWVSGQQSTDEMLTQIEESWPSS